MNIEKIMGTIKDGGRWMSAPADGLQLQPCPYCGQTPFLTVMYPHYGLTGATVRCKCGAQGPRASIIALMVSNDWGYMSTPLIPQSLERGITAAIDAWNSGAYDRSRMGNLRIPLTAADTDQPRHGEEGATA